MGILVLTLAGKTLKGKNRIREHGERWTLIRQEERNGERLLFVQAVKQTKYPEFRWIKAENDPDFEIKEVGADGILRDL